MSVRKEHQVTKSGQTRVCWVVDITDAQGKRRTRKFERRNDAEIFHHHQRAEVRDAKVSFARACERWIERCRDENLKPTTVADYEAFVNRYIVPLLGRLSLADLTPNAFRRLRAQMIEDGVSAATVRRALVYVVRILKTAQEEGNVSLTLWTPSVVRRLLPRPPQTRREPLVPGIHFPSKEEVCSYLRAAAFDIRTLISVGCTAGLYPSELLGLVWTDIDLDAEFIKVQRRVGNNTLSNLPIPARYRTIPIPSAVVVTLREWRLSCASSPDNLVFPGKDGRLMSKSAAERQFKVVQSKAHNAAHPDGAVVTSTTSYSLVSLRHFYGYWCATSLEAGGLGMPLTMLRRLLGHSSIFLTLYAFGHFFDDNPDACHFPDVLEFLSPLAEP